MFDKDERVKRRDSESCSSLQQIEEDEDVDDGGKKAENPLLDGGGAKARRLQQNPN